MGSVIADISMSLDGFVTGPNDDVGRGLGEGSVCTTGRWVAREPTWTGSIPAPRA